MIYTPPTIEVVYYQNKQFIKTILINIYPNAGFSFIDFVHFWMPSQNGWILEDLAFCQYNGPSDRIQNGKIMTSVISFLNNTYIHKLKCLATSSVWFAAVGIITRVVPAGQGCVSCSEQSNTVIVHVNAATVAHGIGYTACHIERHLYSHIVYNMQQYCPSCRGSITVWDGCSWSSPCERRSTIRISVTQGYDQHVLRINPISCSTTVTHNSHKHTTTRPHDCRSWKQGHFMDMRHEI